MDRPACVLNNHFDIVIVDRLALDGELHILDILVKFDESRSDAGDASSLRNLLGERKRRWFMGL